MTHFSEVADFSALNPAGLEALESALILVEKFLSVTGGSQTVENEAIGRILITVQAEAISRRNA